MDQAKGSVGESRQQDHDLAPGEGDFSDAMNAVKTYAVGLAFATVLTVLSFSAARSGLIWAPAIPVTLIVLAVAQMGVHIVFFLHITTGPEGTNNVLALAFGILIVILVVGGSLWIMTHLNNNMMPMGQMMDMQR